jgi:hypothetical protein
MAEDTLPAVSEKTGELAETLRDSIEKRFSKVVGGELRGDKVPDILRSVEKLMFVQTEFLSSISNSLKDQLALQADAIEDSETAEKLSSVSENEDNKNQKSMFEGFKSAVLERTDSDKFDTDFAKKMGLAVAGGLLLKGFGGALFDDIADNFNLSEDTRENVKEGTEAGLFTSVFGALFPGKDKDGKRKSRFKGGLKGFALGFIANTLGQAVEGLDFDGDGKILGADKETVGGITEAIAGFGLFAGAGKILGKLTQAAKDSVSKMRGLPTSAQTFTKVTPGGATPTKAPLAPTPSTPAKPSIASKIVKGTSTVASKATAAIPGAMTINTAGQVSRADGVKGIFKKLKSMNPEKAAKFAKFFKFAGPAAAIIPALIEPAMAIANDAPDDVVKKEIAGALGSIGGTALGVLAGGALGTAIPVPFIGSGIGGFLGGVAGAFGGEALAERIAEFFMGGGPINKDELQKMGNASNRRKNARKGTGSSPSLKPSENVSAQITGSDGATTGAVTGAVTDSGATGTPSNISATESNLGLKAQAISTNQAVKDQTSAMIQQNAVKGGDVVTTNTVGGTTNTFNILKGGGGGSLANHLPVLQS